MSLLPHKKALVLSSKQNAVFLPDESANVSFLLNHMRTQVNTLNDLT